jgi:PAS domain S-box-containing protein
MATETILRILYAEDEPLDVELVARALQDQGVQATCVRVDTREAFLHALESEDFDLILSDYSMPAFDGLSALELAQEKRPDIPFIHISGTIGEERAVEALQKGATDYVLKDRLFRLGAVIRRSLKDKALRLQKSLVEEELHGTLTKLQRLVAASPTVTYSAPFPPGPLTTFVSENVKERFGYEAETIITEADFWISRIHPDDQEGVRSRLGALGTQPPGVAVYRFLHADGSWRWVEDRVNLVRDETGAPREIVGSWVDVTDLRRMHDDMARMQAEIHQAQKLEAIGSLAGGVAHDFNNILMVILSYATFLLAKLPPDSELRREVLEIRNAGNRAADLTQQLLAFSRKETLNPQEINPSEAVRNLSRMIGRLIGDNIRLSLDLGQDSGFILCDPTQFDQILINLIVNARDAMPEGGEVVIRTGVTAPVGSPADECFISVGDSGVGIAPDLLDKIFEPFFTTKAEGKGTGLGLSMVYGAVRQNGGRITVESALGKGTVMSVFFERRDATPLFAQDARALNEEPCSPLTILLVEHDDSVRRATTLLLESLGCTVIPAGGGEQALKIYGERKVQIDCIVTDVIMPEMGGAELWRRVREMDPAARIVFCTGYVSEIEMVERALGEGAAIVQKPFDGRTILNKIRSLPQRGARESAP